MMLQRDQNSQAIVNADAQALNKYKQERALYRKVNSLHSDISDIKETLNRLCERLDRIENE